MARRRPKYDEDLFRDSTMTFGEHLEELRKALFRAVLGLVVGVLVGLAFADQVVDYVQKPLNKALMRYYQDEASDTLLPRLRELRAAGHPVPEEKVIKEQLRQGLLPEVHWIDRKGLRDLLNPNPTAASSTASVADDSAGDKADAAGDLQPIVLYHPAANDPRVHTRSLSTGEPFFIWFKAALLVGAVLASPWIFYQIWAFVAAGLYPHEKRYVHVYLPFSLGLFISGVLLAFFFAMQPVLDFLLSFNRWMGIAPELRISEWLSFVLLLPLGFGISFQLPLVMLFLERIGIFTVRSYTSRWRVSVLVIFVLSMVCTPGDPYSMLLMAVTLTVLYFGGILLCKLMPRQASEFEELDEQYA